jgi:Holliday junction resolvase RusA-like endonuclease
MTNAVHFFVPGEPVAKGRARVTTIGGHPRQYTPAKTVAYESTVALIARQAMGASDPIAGPVAVYLQAVWAIPASWSKKRAREAMGKYKASRPDLDNLIKSICDGCNGITWNDDAQVVQLRAEKFYGAIPGVTVEIIGMDCANDQ